MLTVKEKKRVLLPGKVINTSGWFGDLFNGIKLPEIDNNCFPSYRIKIKFARPLFVCALEENPVEVFDYQGRIYCLLYDKECGSLGFWNYGGLRAEEKLSLTSFLGKRGININLYGEII